MVNTAVVNAQIVEEFKFDVVIYYTSDEGWDIIAKEGWQIGPKVYVIVYTNQPGVLSMNAVAGNEKVFEVNEVIDFKKEYPISIPSSKYGHPLTITATMTYGKISKSIIKSYTIVKSPIPPRTAFLEMFTPEQIRRIISEIRWDTIFKSLIAAVAGIAVAIFLKYKCMMLEPFNALQIPFLVAAIFTAHTLEGESGIGYFMVYFIANFMSYKFLKGPALIGILEIRNTERDVWDVLLPIYITEDGGIAIALQRSDYALKRLLGKHIYLKLRGQVETLWRKNGSYDLIIASRTELKKLPVESEEPVEESEGLELKKKRKEVMTFEVDVCDVHQINFIINAKTFDKIRSELKKLHEEHRSLISAMDHIIEKAKTDVIKDWAKMRGTIIGDVNE
ncbi:MAG: hypothetical protein RMI45_08670 [Ignisphaera sp.]|nr:hypothetical protein [Ignisphaera sp.]